MNYLLYGEETYRIKQNLKTIIAQYVDEDDPFSLSYHDARKVSFETILEDLTTIPFLSDYKVVVVEHANFLGSNNDTQIELKQLENYLKNENPSSILILIGDFDKLDSRKGLCKKIKETWKIFVCNRLDEKSKIGYIEEQIKNRGLKLSVSAKRKFIQYVPLDMMIIQSELDKLCLFHDDIDDEVIEALTSRTLNDDVFALVNAVVQKNVKKALLLWKDFDVLNVEVIYLISLLASQFRFMYQVRTLMNQNQGKEAIAKTLHAHPYRVQLVMQSCYRLRCEDILERLAQLASLDQKIKAGQIDKKLGFELFLLKI